MRAPSAKALLGAFGQLSQADARLIRALAGAAADGRKLKKLIDTRVPATVRYANALFGDPYRSQFLRTAIVLHALNNILGTHGIQGLGPARPGDYAPAYEYLNMGDPYISTLIYDREGDRLFVSSWGDLLEKHPEWESRNEHATIRRGSSIKSPVQLDREIRQALSQRGGR